MVMSAQENTRGVCAAPNCSGVGSVNRVCKVTDHIVVDRNKLVLVIYTRAVATVVNTILTCNDIIVRNGDERSGKYPRRLRRTQLQRCWKCKPRLQSHRSHCR